MVEGHVITLSSTHHVTDSGPGALVGQRKEDNNSEILNNLSVLFTMENQSKTCTTNSLWITGSAPLCEPWAVTSDSSKVPAHDFSGG